MAELVFVYGTLMHEQPNHRVLVECGARRVGEAVTVEERTLVDLGPYPALLARGRGAGVASRIVGEIYEVEEAQLAVLDAFEGCPDLYSRERVGVVIGASEVEAWTYVLAGEAPSHASIVTTGRYAGGGVVLQVNAKEAEKDALDGATERDALDKRR